MTVSLRNFVCCALLLIGCRAARVAEAPGSTSAIARQRGVNAPGFTVDPDSARIITSDIDLFWRVVDRAPAESLDVVLQREYIDKGSVGVKDFIANRISSGPELAKDFLRARSRYEATRTAAERIAQAEPAIRSVFRKLKALYPEAVFPDVYFVIGRFNSAGTASPRVLILAAEMVSDPRWLVPTVAHELIHVQQTAELRSQPSLLAQAVREGVAVFVGVMLAGDYKRAPAYAYAIQRERELWTEFKAQMHGTSYGGWMYGAPTGDRPRDLGYFFGYRIAEAYYARASDKATAIGEMIRVTDVNGFLARSGYDP